MKKVLIPLLIIMFLSGMLFQTKGLKVYRIISDSMTPDIKKGYLVIVSKSQNLKVGDIISYRTSQEAVPITHRISKIFQNNGKYFFTTKGDNNYEKDPYPISEDEIIGRVILTVPGISLDSNKELYKIAPILALIVIGYCFGRITTKLLNSLDIS